METNLNTENSVEEAANSSDEDISLCDQESVASSVESIIDEMFIDGLDPFLDRPSTEIDSPEKDCDLETDLQRKRPCLSSTSTCCKAGDSVNGGRRRSLRAVSTNRWHSADETDVEPPLLLFTPLQTPGPKSVYSSCSSPLQFFKLFISKSLMHAVVGHTNVYGMKYRDKMAKRWLFISLKDFMAFIALVIYMGLFKCSSLKDYWSKSQHFSVPFPARVMSYRNFQIISNAFHLSNTSEDEKNDVKKGTSSYEKLHKIQLLYQEMREACRKYFHPFQNITIDERMVTSQAKTKLKECSKTKSASRGYKLFALSDCTTGYTWDFFICEGRSRASRRVGLSYESVMALVDENFLGTGYKLFVDKFYTGPVLFRDLLLKNMGACGPVWANREGFPKTSINKLARNASRGTMRWIRDNELLFVNWKDVQEVQMCSTFHKAGGGDTVQRKVKGRNGKRTNVDIPIPAAVLDYMRAMKAVDPSHRITEHYRELHKPKKWYQCFFYHFLDIAVENSFILHNLMAKERNKKVLTHKAFLETLIEELTQVDPQTRTQPGPVLSVPVSALPSDLPPMSSSSASSLDTSPLFHMPKHISGDRTIGRLRCKQCHLKTPFMCSTCNVSLCFQPKRDCFNQWHAQQFF